MTVAVIFTVMTMAIMLVVIAIAIAALFLLGEFG